MDIWDQSVGVVGLLFYALHVLVEVEGFGASWHFLAFFNTHYGIFMACLPPFISVSKFFSSSVDCLYPLQSSLTGIPEESVASILRKMGGGGVMVSSFLL